MHRAIQTKGPLWPREIKDRTSATITTIVAGSATHRFRRMRRASSGLNLFVFDIGESLKRHSERLLTARPHTKIFGPPTI